jgi:hypothetical protein
MVGLCVFWRQLVENGWEELTARTIVIPKGCAMIFSTFLLHAGAKWELGDCTTFNRLHFYMTPFLMKDHPV